MEGGGEEGEGRVLHSAAHGGGLEERSGGCGTEEKLKLGDKATSPRVEREGETERERERERERQREGGRERGRDYG